MQVLPDGLDPQVVGSGGKVALEDVDGGTQGRQRLVIVESTGPCGQVALEVPLVAADLVSHGAVVIARANRHVRANRSVVGPKPGAKVARGAPEALGDQLRGGVRPERLDGDICGRTFWPQQEPGQEFLARRVYASGDIVAVGGDSVRPEEADFDGRWRSRIFIQGLGRPLIVALVRCRFWQPRLIRHLGHSAF
jgi:hypothetical protein